ncbi:uncharacterized protein K444DRAFT_689993 [Hyaloscypha bicolor E]|uniref:Uncharacterized protein n=1 Tax=Hyaloscypha bicolor E TaxID=1095630 RepID=A0A2J6TWG5_9HELO|nr:uncharacterized protein K444DRAFT_689993 [Hyaloscypha bicolor E]PMD67369.1 hypothetical protein K444DRAFT_689993 [Hyaloscypha bicolor E]
MARLLRHDMGARNLITFPYLINSTIDSRSPTNIANALIEAQDNYIFKDATEVIKAIKDPVTEVIKAIKDPATEVIEASTTKVIKAPTAEVIEAPTAEVIEAPTAKVIEAPTAKVIKAPTAKVIKAPTANTIKALAKGTTAPATIATLAKSTTVPIIPITITKPEPPARITLVHEVIPKAFTIVHAAKYGPLPEAFGYQTTNPKANNYFDATDKAYIIFHIKKLNATGTNIPYMNTRDYSKYLKSLSKEILSTKRQKEPIFTFFLVINNAAYRIKIFGKLKNKILKNSKLNRPKAGNIVRIRIPFDVPDCPEYTGKNTKRPRIFPQDFNNNGTFREDFNNNTQEAAEVRREISTEAIAKEELR